MGFLVTGVVLAFSGWKGPRRRHKNLAPLLVILLTVFVACGGNGNGAGSSTTGHPGTPPGNHTITVNGVVGSITRSTQVALTVQ
jgi:hypothetical protein